jgi:hypothetical protein
MNRNNLDNLIKPVASGVIGGLGAEFLYPGLDKVVYGMNVPTYILDGLVIGASSLVNATWKNQILYRLGLENSHLGTGSMLAGPVITGTTTVGVTLLLNGFDLSDKTRLLTLFLLGAISEVGGHYVSEVVLKPVVPMSNNNLITARR